MDGTEERKTEGAKTVMRAAISRVSREALGKGRKKQPLQATPIQLLSEHRSVRQEDQVGIASPISQCL